jgi:hypothetical protein
MRLQVDYATNLGLYCPPFSVDLPPLRQSLVGQLRRRWPLLREGGRHRHAGWKGVTWDGGGECYRQVILAVAGGRGGRREGGHSCTSG